VIRRVADRIELQGPVTLDTTPELVTMGEPLIRQGSAVIDFANVSEVDSAAVALALEWLRQSESLGNSLTFANLPDSMKNLAALYGVAGFISPTSS